MACKDILSRVGAYVDGELGGDDRCEVEQHLCSCESCARIAEEFRALDDLAARQKIPPVSGEEWARLWERVRAGVAGPGRTRGVETRSWGPTGRFQVLRRSWSVSPRRFVVGAAAAAAVLLVGFFLVRIAMDRPASQPDLRTVVPKTEKTHKTEDYAEHLSGPQPEITVDPTDGTTHLRYEEF